MFPLLGRSRIYVADLERENPRFFNSECKSSNNPGQNILNKIEKSSKTGQGKKSLISTFACFLAATAKV